MLFVTIVLDGVGIGAQPDAGRYGDAGADTLGRICEIARPRLPNLSRLGLGCIASLEGVAPAEAPRAHFGRMRAVSAGKDSTTGHWELAGQRLDAPFPTYPQGFPSDVIEAFVAKTECGGVLGNRAASGTQIVRELGAQHQQTGRPIVYTSADSVFQIAAHKETIPLERLYAWCEIARTEVCVGAHGVGRIIARPFTGAPGRYTRISAERKDFARPPERPPLQLVLQQSDVRTVAVGKIADLFAGVGFDEASKTKSNAEGIAETLDRMRAFPRRPRHVGATFLWTNLVDFDQEYGHRQDPEGFARALEAFDHAVPDLLEALPENGRLVLTADHGNDPADESTDHTREYVPLLYYDGHAGHPLGKRATLNDHAATVAACFGVNFETDGTSFAQEGKKAGG